MKKKITKSQIKNIGKRLKAVLLGDSLNEQDLVSLNEWRLHHDSSLKYCVKLLKSQLFTMGLKEGQFTLTQRLKRVYSIILKLKRYEQMQLSMMEDIAGVRVVLPETTYVDELIDRLKARKSKYEIIKVNNYISRPKDDGYRGIHVIYKIKKEPDIFIEVQLRTDLQHVWATGVEVFGTLENTSFKTGEGAKKWKDFFSLLSSYFALKEETAVIKAHEIYSRNRLKKLLIDKIKDLNIIEQLDAYTSIYTSDWRSNRVKGRSGKFALLILDTEKNNTDVKFYSEANLNKALKDYVEIEKSNHSSQAINVVLVNLSNMENLEAAYPNYFMNTEKLSYYLSKIVLGEF